MKISDQPSISVLSDPVEIKLVQLISAKHAIKLEKLGMRHSRIRCGVRGLWAKHYKMPPRSSHDEVLTRIQEEITQLSEKLNGQRQLEL